MRRIDTRRVSVSHLDAYNTVISRTCSVTNEQVEVNVSRAEWERIIAGTEPMQNIVPHLSIGERELIISGYTPKEWEAMFGGHNEEGEHDA